MVKFGKCVKCGAEDILNADGLCPICEAENKGMKYRCFHCLRFFATKPVRCPHCGCLHLTPIKKCRDEDEAIERSARQAANVPEETARLLASLEIERIRRETAE